jgi:predicted DNA-binding protein
MSEPTGRGGVKTLAIRLPDELHAQLVLVASLEDKSLADTIRQAIEELIERKRAGGDLAAQAAKALEEIDRETAARRHALQALLGEQQAPGEESAPSRKPRRGESAS